MEAYVAELKHKLTARFGPHRLYVYGHLADGNLHLAIGVTDARAHGDVDAIVYGSLSADNSSVSAEHGIGLAKKQHLPRSRNEAELAVMRALKHALDPRGILNRGKIFD
jgi:FAD/FMN-containing dehydrogenase